MCFNLADYIVMFENSYFYFSTGGGNASLDTIEPMYRSKSIIDIYDFDGNATVQSGIVNDLLGMGFGGLYLKDPPNSPLAQTRAYDHFEPLLGVLWTVWLLQVDREGMCAGERWRMSRDFSGYVEFSRSLELSNSMSFLGI